MGEGERGSPFFPRWVICSVLRICTYIVVSNQFFDEIATGVSSTLRSGDDRPMERFEVMIDPEVVERREERQRQQTRVYTGADGEVVGCISYGAINTTFDSNRFACFVGSSHLFFAWSTVNSEAHCVKRKNVLRNSCLPTRDRGLKRRRHETGTVQTLREGEKSHLPTWHQPSTVHCPPSTAHRPVPQRVLCTP